jgi:hypothetical protein
LRRLRVDTIDLYQLHRVDPAVPLAETWGALADMVTEGKLRGLGISHATVEELDLIHAIHPLTAVQYELSILATDNLRDILPWCRANNVGFLAFAPIGRGFLSGKIASGSLVDGDSRIRLYNAKTGQFMGGFSAYPNFQGGVSVATADVNGDGVTDIIVGAGPGGGPHIQVVNGSRIGLLQGLDQIAPPSAMLEKAMNSVLPSSIGPSTSPGPRISKRWCGASRRNGTHPLRMPT